MASLRDQISKLIREKNELERALKEVRCRLGDLEDQIRILWTYSAPEP